MLSAWGCAAVADRCTCEFGRASDGSEHGPCVYCEDAPYREAAEAKSEREDELIEEEDLWPM